MQKNAISLLALTFVVPILLSGATRQAQAQAEMDRYPAMASPSQYLIPDEHSEIALARSAAPASISDGAEVLVLGRQGYTTAVKGTNGFVCLVERSWGAATDFPEFWNPKNHLPHMRESASRKDLSARRADEGQTGAGRKIKDGNRASSQTGV